MSGLDEFQYLRISDSVSDEIAKLLEQNIVGTPGQSMLYAQTRVGEKLRGLHNSRFASLYLGGRVVGTICFLKREIIGENVAGKAFYIRYFTFLEKYRSSAGPQRRGKENAIRQEVNRIMAGEGLGIDGEYLLYAYVDPENSRSKRLIDEFGFTRAGVFRTIPFTRFFPRKSENVQLAEGERIHEISALFDSGYQRYSLYTTEHLRGKGDFFFIEKDQRIVCAVQAIPDSWKIISLPGVSGTIMMKAVPFIPLLRRLFRRDYRFVFFERVYCESGSEASLEQLFESALVHFSRYTAIFCLDPHSPIYASVKRLRLGLTHRLMGEKEVEIVCKTSSGDNQIRSPFYISGIDVL